MTEEAMILELDIIELKHKKEMQRLEKEVTESVTKEVTKEITHEKNATIKKLIQKLRGLGATEEEILEAANLTKEQLQELGA